MGRSSGALYDRWKSRLLPRIVATVSDDETIPVQIANIQGSPVTIPPNTEVGIFHTIQEDGNGMYEVFDRNDTQEHIPTGEWDKVIQDLHIEEAAVSDAGKRVLKRLVTEYRDIFSKNDDDLGKTQILKHHINTGDAQPVRQRPRRIPIRLREEVEAQKSKMLKDGIIEESTSPWCSPIVLAKKKDGSFRFCVDLRAVNGVTQSLPHPLPRVDDALDSLAGAKFFSTLDMASGYWQVDLADEDKKKTAFTTGKGLHQFRAMPFGLKNAGATFQRLMELVLAGMDSRNCLVYIDDIIVFGETEQAHLKNLEEVFQRIRDAGMKLKPRKCCLARDEVVFLGHKVSHTGVQPDPANVAKVKEWPRPVKAEDLKSFLGLTGYYSKFVPDYSDIARPIREEAEKKGKIEWSNELIESFEGLKKRLISPPILALPSFKGTFKLATDASNSAVGAVLSELIDGEEKVIAYASKVLSKTERRWPTYDKELWAIVWAIRHFRQYLVGAPFEVLTDHKPLLNAPQSIDVDKDATGRRGRWAVELSTHDFQVTHRKGLDNGNADAMSRRMSRNMDEEEKPSEIHVVKEDEESIIRDVKLESMKFEQELDPTVNLMKEWVVDGKLPSKKKLKKCSRELRTLARFFDQMVIEEDILKMQKEHEESTTTVTILPRVYREMVLKMLHNDCTAGHFGAVRTRERVLKRFFWPTVEKDVREHCETCIECQRRSQPTPPRQAAFRTETSSKPFERMAIDITEMPMSSRGNKYTLVVMDYFSKYVYVYPMPDQTARTVSECLMDVVLRQGVPERLHSDQGRQFESHVFQELCARLGIEKTRTSPYRPQSDGMVERFNRTLKDMVAKYIKPCGSDWDEHITALAFAYNTSKHSVTGYSPFFLVHGREARLPVDELFGASSSSTADIDSHVEDVLRKLRTAFGKVKENTERAAYEMIKRQGDVCRESNYAPGQKVWLTDHTAQAGGKRKLGMRYKGPGEVIRQEGPREDGVVYRVRMPDGKEVKTHHNHIKPMKERQQGSRSDGMSRRTEPTEDDGISTDQEERDTVQPTEERELSDNPNLMWILGSGQKSKEEEKSGYVTRSGRTVQQVVKYQA